MGIDINLLSKKRKIGKAKGLVSNIAVSVLILFSLYFFSSSIWVVYKFFSLSRELSLVNAQTLQLSDEIRSKNETVTKYVLSKNILDYYEVIQKSKFHYKLYLDQIVDLVPSGILLRSVDFANKGWISVSFQIPSHVALKDFEEVMTKGEVLEKTSFGSVYIESVTRDKLGQYVVKMQLAIKNNA